jgi:tRNA (guanine-N7-)-methyltransferase
VQYITINDNIVRKNIDHTDLFPKKVMFVSPEQKEEFAKNNPYVSEIEKFQEVIFNHEAPEDLIDWSNSFPIKQPIVLDLGCGAGNFLRDLAKKNSHFNYIGFELRYKRLVLGARKFTKHGVENIRLVRSKAEDIGKWFPENSIQRIHVNFPDPWAKSKQRKHRLLQEKQFKIFHQLLTASGDFVFKTDHKEYFHSTHNLLKKIPYFEIVEYSEDLHQSEFNEDNVLTEFEGLFKGKGLPTYYLRAKVV